MIIIRSTENKVEITMAILVTGATGFIAQWIVFYLLQEKYQVIGTVRSYEKAERLHRQFGGPSNLSFEIIRHFRPKGF